MSLSDHQRKIVASLEKEIISCHSTIKYYEKKIKENGGHDPWDWGRNIYACTDKIRDCEKRLAWVSIDWDSVTTTGADDEP